jgi:hypothetical protein
MTLAEMLKDDEPYQHKPLTGFGACLFSIGMAKMHDINRDQRGGVMEAEQIERPMGHAVETAADMFVLGTTQDIQRFRRQKAAAQATAMCGAMGTPAFLEAVAFYTEALEQIERVGKCQACSFTLIGGDIECSRCGQIND